MGDENWFPSQRAAYDAGRAEALAETEHTIASLRASLTRAEAEREEAVKAMEPIADLYRLLLNQASGFELMRAGVANGDFERIALLHNRLSRASGPEGNES